MAIASYKYPKYFLLITVLSHDLKCSCFPSKILKNCSDGLEKNLKRAAVSFP